MSTFTGICMALLFALGCIGIASMNIHFHCETNFSEVCK